MIWMIDRFLKIEDEFLVSLHGFEDESPHVLLCLISIYLKVFYGLSPYVALYICKMVMRQIV